MTAETLRTLLVAFGFAMYLLAILYLRRRPLTWSQFVVWGTFALVVPILGPFLTILARPGGKQKRSEIVRARRRRSV